MYQGESQQSVARSGCGTARAQARVAAEIWPLFNIQDVNVFVRLSKCNDGDVNQDGTCSNQDVDTFPEDIGIALTAPGGTTSARLQPVKSFNEQPPTWTQFSPGPIQNVSITFDQASSNPIGPAPKPTEGTFRPEQDLSVFSGRNANGPWTLEFTDVDGDSDPTALLEWQLIVTCAPLPIAEPTCEAGTFIRPGAFFWGSPETLTQSPTGGWPDVCAKTFDECQNALSQTAPGTLDTTCACSLWDCLQPCYNPESPSVSLCPATGGPQPACPPFELRRFLCDQLKAGGATTCGASSAPFPTDCATLIPAGAGKGLSKRLRRNKT